MTLTIILSFFSGISFLFYGISSFRSRRMKAEFERWGFLNHRFTIGTFQILGGLGLLLGLMIPYLLLISSLALTLMMLVAILVRIRIKDELLKIIPALFYMMINGIIFYLVIMNDFL
ncbi:MAG: DoxX family protein [Flavobacteriaceae bacterium]|nr:DoxX family protein [Flavobacteriaceae bacterium]